MSRLNLVTVPNDLLYEISRPVEEGEFGAELEEKLSDMAETMYANSGVGLSGVQVGDLRRILVADMGYVTGEGYRKTSIKMVNPVIAESSEETISVTEGCLSYPNFEQKVPRAAKIRVEYFTPDGQSREIELDGLQAIVIQHEIDHLDGITLLSRASLFKRNRYLNKIRKKVREFKKQLKKRMSQR